MGGKLSLQELQSLFASAERLPQIPNSPLRLSELLENTNASPQQIEDAIHADPALTASILRASSSAVFGRKNAVTTVKEAVLVLGQNSIRSLAVALWTNSLVSSSSHKSQFDAKKFALNGLFVGACTSKFAETSKFRGDDGTWSKDEIFAAGVMHQLPFGLLSLLSPQTFDVLYDQAKTAKHSLDQSFELAYGKQIGDIAEPALINLVIPEKFHPVILARHDSACPEVVALLQNADQFSYQFGAGFLPWAPNNENSENIDFLGQDQDEIGELAKTTAEFFTAA